MKYITSIILLFTLCFQALAQQNNYSFLNFSTKNGLSSNTVQAILKDSYGYMWFATNDGLNKFDGINFTAYRHNPIDSMSIGVGEVMDIREDLNGNLWVCTSTTLSCYNRKMDVFINYYFTNKGSIRSLCIDYKGNIWVGTYSGIFIVNPKSNQITHYLPNTNVAGKPKVNFIICIYEDSNHKMWIGTSTGLFLFVESNKSFKKFVHDYNDPNSISDTVIRTIKEDAKGNIWFGTSNGGLNLLEKGSNHFKHFQHNPNDINSISCDRIYAIAFDKDNKLWLGTEEGLNIFDPQTLKSIRILSDNRNKYSLTGKSIRSIYIGSDGIYWIGTYQAGVSKYDTNLAFFNLRQSNPFDAFGLTSPSVTALIEDPSGNIYLGTDGGGLNLYHPKTGLFDHPQLSTEKLKHIVVLAMEMVGNELWVGTYLDGIYVKNIVTGSVKHFEKGSGTQNLSNNEIFCIKKDSKGNIWIGTNGAGIDKYDAKTRQFYRFSKNSVDANGGKLPLNGFIRAIEEDRFGNIWIGSNGTGIAVHTVASKSFKILNSTNSNLPSGNILDIHEDRVGNMWVSTSSGGLSLFDASVNKFKSYSEPEGLANGMVYKILEDNNGKLWVTTNKSISSFDPKTSRFKNYFSYNGLQQSPFNRAAGIKTTSGELFFGGLEGFNYFNPNNLSSNRNVPPLVFTDLKISNKTVVPNEQSAISEHISIAKEIQLNYKQNFSLEFAALNYTAPQESQYFYKLDKFDKDWIQAGPSRLAVYTNLYPGKYVFRLKAKSDDGLWKTEEKLITIHVSPPIWLTGYAYVFYILVIGGILWGVRYRGIHKLKNKFAAEQERIQFKQMLEQERIEAERKHEFDLGKIKFLTNLSHEFRTPISLIMDPVEGLLQQEENDKKIEQLSLIRRNARRLLNLVNQLLDFKKLEEHELKLNLTEGDFIAFVKEVGDAFKDISERRGITFAFASAINQFNTTFDRDKVERILFNLLSNAFKFTKANGTIWLKIDRALNGDIKIVIEDTGVGMSPEVQYKIFDRFFQDDTNKAIMNQGSGIGLSITKEFVNLHNGIISVESIVEKGTVFTVQLPLKAIQKFIAKIDLNTSIQNDDTLVINLKDKSVKTPEMPTVLLIEDHEDLRNYLTANLSSFYKIIEAADGKQGWQKALSAHPQVIVSDINMPEMDGITLCQKLKSDKRTNHIPVILLTALTGDENQLKGLNTGANDYLTKPFKFEILHVKIKNLLNLNQNLKNTYSRQLNVVAPEINVESEDEKLLLKIIKHVEENIDNTDLSVEELSKHVFMSRGALYSKIISLTGETPVEFIRSIKLKKAAVLLENSDLKISQIGYMVGFTTPNYFARAFKVKYNLSPSEYVSLKRKLPSISDNNGLK